MAAWAGLLQSRFEEAARGPSGVSAVSSAAQVESRAVRERRQGQAAPLSQIQGRGWKNGMSSRRVYGLAEFGEPGICGPQ